MKHRLHRLKDTDYTDKKDWQIVGLTGNIASGKTTVARIFRQLGAKIIDMDKLGHQFLQPKGRVWKRIVSSFGKEILNYDQSINRRKLGKIVFGDFRKLRRLNEIIHPHLIQKIKEEISQSPKKTKKGIIIIDGALLVELKPLFKILDYLILVKIAQATQIKRFEKNKDRLSRREIIQRLRAQLSQKKKIKLADFIIDNSGSREKTKKQVKQIWKELNE